jgi:hypothetical protein
MQQDVRRCGLDELVVQAGPAHFHLMLVQADGTWQYLAGLLSSLRQFADSELPPTYSKDPSTYRSRTLWIKARRDWPRNVCLPNRGKVIK